MKQFSKDKIQRMRNLATGNYSEKTKTSSGYKKYSKRMSEGDVWEEDGKTWTIKNGIKQNSNKLGDAREEMKIPLSCPKCNTAMNKQAHKKMYRLYKHCLHCQTADEHSMRAKGLYKEWMEKTIRSNFGSWKTLQEDRFNKWFSTIDSKNYITEAGKIEDWSKLTISAKQDIKNRFKEWIDSEKEITEKLLKGEKQ
jgi:hypothetical protein